MNVEKTLLSKIFCHLVELLSVQYSGWEMVAMVVFVEVSLMAPFQASSDTWLSRAHH